MFWPFPSKAGGRELRLHYRLCEHVKLNDNINWSLYKTTENTLGSPLKQTETGEEEARATCFCFSCIPKGETNPKTLAQALFNG